MNAHLCCMTATFGYLSSSRKAKVDVVQIQSIQSMEFTVRVGEPDVTR